jgi:RecA-family ATPase
MASFDVETARALSADPDAGGASLLGPLLAAGQRTVVLGATGSGKTTLSLGLLSAALRGTAALGYQGAGLGSALLLDCEQGRGSLQRSLAEAGLADRDDLHVVSVPGGVMLDRDLEARAELESLVAALRPRLVLLDPAYQLVSSDSRAATLKLVSLLDRLRAEYGFALILPMHPRKTTSGGRRRPLELDDVAGTGAVLWNAELVLGMERVADGRAQLRVLKDRDGGIGQGVVLDLAFERGVGFTLAPPAAAPMPRASKRPVEWWLAMGSVALLFIWIVALASGHA